MSHEPDTFYTPAIKVLQRYLDEKNYSDSETWRRDDAAGDPYRAAIALLRLSDGDESPLHETKRYERSLLSLIGALSKWAEATNHALLYELQRIANQPGESGVYATVILQALRISITEDAEWKYTTEREDELIRRGVALREAPDTVLSVRRARFFRRDVTTTPEGLPLEELSDRIHQVTGARDYDKATPEALSALVQVGRAPIPPNAPPSYRRGHILRLTLPHIDGLGTLSVDRHTYPDPDDDHYARDRDNLYMQLTRALDEAWCSAPNDPHLHRMQYVGWVEIYHPDHLRTVVGWTALQALIPSLSPAFLYQGGRCKVPILPAGIPMAQVMSEQLVETLEFDFTEMRRTMPPAAMIRALYRAVKFAKEANRGGRQGQADQVLDEGLPPWRRG